MAAFRFISFILFIIVLQILEFSFVIDPHHSSGLKGLYIFTREILQDICNLKRADKADAFKKLQCLQTTGDSRNPGPPLKNVMVTASTQTTES
jgi:hypothetical protein